jgi:hypothetical protein
MKNNSIVTNLQQDLTSSEQLQARNNINAAKTVVVTNPATGFSGDVTVDYSVSLGTYELKVNNGAVGLLPGTPAGPNLVFGTNNEGKVSWNQPQSTATEYKTIWDNDSSNTVVIDPTGKGYIECPYTKFLFTCQIASHYTSLPKDISLCPVNYIGQSYSQPTLSEGGRPYLVHLPPVDDLNYSTYDNWTTVSCVWNHPDIRYIAIKGNSDWVGISDYKFDIANITMVKLP